MSIDVDSNGEEKVAETDSKTTKKTTNIPAGVYKPR